MRTPASICKHPIHPMLVVFPVGLCIFFLVCDLIRLIGAPEDAWATVAPYSMVGALVGALCAAIPGFIDLLFYKGGAPPGSRILHRLTWRSTSQSWCCMRSISGFACGAPRV
jgi:uncharacterized membrane protein